MSESEKLPILDDGDIFEHKGRTYRVNYQSDDDHGAPWEECEGHGEVSEWTTRDKKPGERVLCSDRHNKRFYDYAAAIKTAKADGWDAEPYGGTTGQRTARAFSSAGATVTGTTAA